jgi:hypothetical protein
MASLLKEAARRGIAPAYVGELLAAADGFTGPASEKQGLIEPLNDRELDIFDALVPN